MIACETWLRRDFLLRNGISPGEPACDCGDCPSEAALTHRQWLAEAENERVLSAVDFDGIYATTSQRPAVAVPEPEGDQR